MKRTIFAMFNFVSPKCVGVWSHVCLHGHLSASLPNAYITERFGSTNLGYISEDLIQSVNGPQISSADWEMSSREVFCVNPPICQCVNWIYGLSFRISLFNCSVAHLLL